LKSIFNFNFDPDPQHGEQSMFVRVPLALTLACTALAFAACDEDVPVNPRPDLAATADMQEPVDLLEPVVDTDGGAPPSTPRPVVISPSGHDGLLGVTVDSAGNIFAVGYVATGTDSTADFSTVVAKFDRNGNLDTSFGQNGFAVKNVAPGTNGEVARGIVVQSTGKIVVSATVEHTGQPVTDPRDRDTALVRFNANGTIDTTFGSQGVKIIDLSDGEVVSGGYVADQTYGLTKYPGSDDRMVMMSVAKRPGGTDLDFVLVRVDADGNYDNNWNGNGRRFIDIQGTGGVSLGASPRMPTAFADGSVIAGGYLTDTTDGGAVKPVVIKLTNTGALDPNFGGGKGYFFEKVLGHTTEVYSVAVQGQKLVTVGYGKDSASDDLDWVSVRLNSDGTLDSTYGTGGKALVNRSGFDDNARNIVVLPDNRILLVGGGRSSMSDSDAMITRLTVDGQPDPTFGIRTYNLGGARDFFWGAAWSAATNSVVLVGTKQVAAGMGNDDGAIFILPVGP
jgi:uncharacterized delta-60 repeat protein